MLWISWKKVKYTALQRSDLIRAEYQAEIAIYDPRMLVFVDESGTDQCNATRHFGYALMNPCNILPTKAHN